MLLGAIYMLTLVQRVFWNPLLHEENKGLADLTLREAVAFAPLAVMMLWIGVYPGTFLAISETAVRAIVGGVQ